MSRAAAPRTRPRLQLVSGPSISSSCGFHGGKTDDSHRRPHGSRLVVHRDTPDEIDENLAAHQWLVSPALSDEREQAVLDLVPLGVIAERFPRLAARLIPKVYRFSGVDAALRSATERSFSPSTGVPEGRVVHLGRGARCALGLPASWVTIKNVVGASLRVTARTRSGQQLTSGFLKARAVDNGCQWASASRRVEGQPACS
jgi:hypothetical protein